MVEVRSGKAMVCLALRHVQSMPTGSYGDLAKEQQLVSLQ